MPDNEVNDEDDIIISCGYNHCFTTVKRSTHTHDFRKSSDDFQQTNKEIIRERLSTFNLSLLTL